MTDARRVLPKDFPALILPQRTGDLHIKALFLSKNQILGKKEVKGVINLLEGYGNDTTSILH